MCRSLPLCCMVTALSFRQKPCPVFSRSSKQLHPAERRKPWKTSNQPFDMRAFRATGGRRWRTRSRQRRLTERGNGTVSARNACGSIDAPCAHRCCVRGRGVLHDDEQRSHRNQKIFHFSDSFRGRVAMVLITHFAPSAHMQKLTFGSGRLRRKCRRFGGGGECSMVLTYGKSVRSRLSRDDGSRFAIAGSSAIGGLFARDHFRPPEFRRPRTAGRSDSRASLSAEPCSNVAQSRRSNIRHDI
jgi:hypothetical protein